MHKCISNDIATVARFAAPRWYEDAGNVSELASWLEAIGYFHETKQLVRFIEKPWKWSAEFDVMQAYHQAQCQEYRQHIVECLLAGEFDDEKPPVSPERVEEIVKENLPF